jgi:predicted RNA binding protein YcfA (HicA-like mRNA interferase family)
MYERPQNLSECSGLRSDNVTVASITRARGHRRVAAWGWGSSLRVKGSHHLLQHPDGRRTVVPVHTGETIGPGLLSKILKDVEMEPEEFAEWL